MPTRCRYVPCRLLFIITHFLCRLWDVSALSPVLNSRNGKGCAAVAELFCRRTFQKIADLFPAFFTSRFLKRCFFHSGGIWHDKDLLQQGRQPDIRAIAAHWLKDSVHRCCVGLIFLCTIPYHSGTAWGQSNHCEQWWCAAFVGFMWRQRVRALLCPKWILKERCPCQWLSLN